MLASDVALYTTERGVATITLNRPERRNALNEDLVFALRSLLRRAAEDDRVRCVVLTGAGNAFSAGADLRALERMQTASFEENLTDSAALAALFKELYVHPKPVIARVNGHAIAGGCCLAAVCDFSIADDRARLGFTEVRIGFVPAIAGVFMRRKLGEGAVRDLMLTGRTMTAQEAAEIGLIGRCVQASALDDAVSTLCSEIVTQTSPEAVRATKALLTGMPAPDLDAALAEAAETNARARTTEDCRAGVQAFLRKEEPPWKREVVNRSGAEKAEDT